MIRTIPILSDLNAFVIDVEGQQIEESFMIWNEKRSPTLLLLLKHVMSMNNTDDHALFQRVRVKNVSMFALWYVPADENLRQLQA
jgi:hypothetical protein